MKSKLEYLARDVRIESTAGARISWDKQYDWQRKANGFTVTLRYKGRRMTVDFWQGPAISGEPNALTVLKCLLSDASGIDQDFESWARDLGYGPDSRGAERIYKAIVKQSAKLQRLLGDDFELFLNAER